MQLPRNFWYPVLESRELKARPLGVERLGQRLVLWRTANGQAHAHLERCPHLGAALSGGEIRKDQLICPFHGFAFDGQGACRHIPAMGEAGRIPGGMTLTGYPLREAHGFLWLWWGAAREAVDYPTLPFFPALAVGWRYGSVVVDWPVHYTRAIENQLDVAHLPFIHRTTIGAGGRTFVDGPYVEADETGIQVWVTNTQDVGRASRSQAELCEAVAGRNPGLHLLFPGVWLLHISPRLKNLIAFVPINTQTTRFYLRVYHRWHNPLLARPFEWLMGLSNRFILNQDRRVVVTQTPPSSTDADADRLIGADRAISQFRRLHASFVSRQD